MRNSLALTAVCAAAMLCGAAHAAPFDCEGSSTPAKLADIGLAAFLESGELHFSACPGTECVSKAYIVRGDTVVAGERKNGWTCALFPNRRGGTSGWLPLNRISPLRAIVTPPLSAWAGEWQMHENASISIKLSGDRLLISGQAFWQGEKPANIHDGELNGTATPVNGIVSLREAKADDYSCAADLRLVGPYLAVEDNGRCGGLNVSFTGVYRQMKR